MMASSYLAFQLEHGDEFVDQFGVPEAAEGLLAHGRGGLLMAEGGFVGASGDQGVVDIDDLQDTRKQRNF